MMLIHTWRSLRLRAPGYCRHEIASLLPGLVSRAERCDWQDRLDATPLLELQCRAGRMWFPIVMADGTHGAIATVEVAGIAHGNAVIESLSGKPVRRWLVQWLCERMNLSRPLVTERLDSLALVWRVGREASPPLPEAEGGLGLEGRSADLACALALLGHVADVSPHDTWVVSGALTGQVGEVIPIGEGHRKRETVALELPDLPPERALIIDGEASHDFEQLLRAILGEDILVRISRAFGMSANSCLDKALGHWRARDEHGAESWAEQTLCHPTTPAQAEKALLILAANAIHRGDTDAASGFFTRLEALPDSPERDPWAGFEWRCRLAGSHLDALDLPSARVVVNRVLEDLQRLGNLAPEMFRLFIDNWRLLKVQALGTSSRIRVAEGRLDDAIRERQEALELGPAQEITRSAMELADLLFRRGHDEHAADFLNLAENNTDKLQQGPARNLAIRFLELVRLRWCAPEVSTDGILAASRTAPDLRQWPQPAEVIATLFRGDETTALKWFDNHVFGALPTLPLHPAYRWMLVTACARAAARGWTSPRWREGPAALVDALAAIPHTDASLIETARIFIAGGPPGPLICRSIY